MLNERIYQERKRLGFSQEELAARVAVSRQAVSKWEAGQAVPDLDKLVQMAKLFGVSLDELCGLADAAWLLDAWYDRGRSGSASFEQGRTFLKHDQEARKRIDRRADPFSRGDV